MYSGEAERLPKVWWEGEALREAGANKWATGKRGWFSALEPNEWVDEAWEE
jgi:hypothetical protein